MKLRSALLAATVMVAPVAAKAEAISGLYIGAGAGANFIQDQSVKSVRFPQRGGIGTAFTGANVQLDTGFVGVASVGYGLGNGLRFEVEGGFRQNKFTSAKKAGARVNAGGDEYKYSGMVNVLYDLDLAAMGLGTYPISPYVGLGAGYAWAQHRNARFYGSAPGISTQLRTNDGDGTFAYQAIIGAAFPLPSVPGLSLTLEYRFMGLAGDRSYRYQYLQGATPANGGNISTRAKVKFEDDYNHSVMLGVRYAFNAAPPPVVAPLAPAPRAEAARTYLVFFDWDRSNLTDRARQIIAEAAQATTRVQVTRIEVSGHTDTSGTARYNQGLSVRRAQAVAAELVRLGVPRAAITSQGFGESRPLVATGPGVREPQNRRVEIVLR